MNFGFQNLASAGPGDTEFSRKPTMAMGVPPGIAG
jgi:hypothetical protein